MVSSPLRKGPSKSKRAIKGVGTPLGLKAFVKISAVEGIRLTGEMKKDFREFERKGLSPEERRRAINSKYGKKSA